MERYISKIDKHIHNQVASILLDGQIYYPKFWHITIAQNCPVGEKETLQEHSHDVYHLVLYTQGSGQYTLNQKINQAIAGHFAIINPGEKHNFVYKWNDSIYSEITFSYETTDGKKLTCPFTTILKELCGVDIKFPENIIFNRNDIDLLNNMFINLCPYINSATPLADYILCSYLNDIFKFIIINHSEHTEDPTKEKFTPALEYIRNHYFKPLDMDHLARLSNVTKGYFFRGFSKAFGSPPMKYQQKLRVESAKVLLSTTNLRINEISRKVGYEDICFFHRIFKRETGVTPKEYREKNS